MSRPLRGGEKSATSELTLRAVVIVWRAPTSVSRTVATLNHAEGELLDAVQNSLSKTEASNLRAASLDADPSHRRLLPTVEPCRRRISVALVSDRPRRV